MRWSKVKKLVEDDFADSVKGRVHVFSTRYECTCGRGWITVDKKEIVDFSTMAAGLKYGAIYHETTKTNCVTHPATKSEERKSGNLAEKGEFSRFDLHEACWEFINSNVDSLLKSENPLILSLAVLSRRVGKRKLKSMDPGKYHPLVKALLEFRKEQEGV